MTKGQAIASRLMNAPLPSITLLVVHAAEEIQRMEQVLLKARNMVAEVDSKAACWTPRVVELLKEIDEVVGEKDECCVDSCSCDLE